MTETLPKEDESTVESVAAATEGSLSERCDERAVLPRTGCREGSAVDEPEDAGEEA